MRTQLILDANVFYYLTQGTLHKGDLCGPGVELCYSPITVIELASNITQWNFEDKRAVARSILDSCARLLPDPDSFLVSSFGLDPSEDQQDWAGMLVTMAEARTMDELLTAVPHSDGSAYRLDAPYATWWRSTIYDSFYNDVIALMDSEIPRFREWRCSQSAGTRKKPRLRVIGGQVIGGHVTIFRPFAVCRAAPAGATEDLGGRRTILGA